MNKSRQERQLMMYSHRQRALRFSVPQLSVHNNMHQGVTENTARAITKEAGQVRVKPATETSHSKDVSRCNANTRTGHEVSPSSISKSMRAFSIGTGVYQKMRVRQPLALCNYVFKQKHNKLVKCSRIRTITHADVIKFTLPVIMRTCTLLFRKACFVQFIITVMYLVVLNWCSPIFFGYSIVTSNSSYTWKLPKNRGRSRCWPNWRNSLGWITKCHLCTLKK